MKKKFAFILFVMSFFSVAGFAQGGKQNMGEMKKRLKDSLKLTDVQIDSVEAIKAEFQPRIKSIMKDESLSKDQKKEKVKPVKQEMVTRLKTFLTDEQFQKLEEMEQEMKKQKGNKTE